MALRVLTDSVLLFNSTVGLLMKRDVELWLKEHGGSHFIRQFHLAYSHTVLAVYQSILKAFCVLDSVLGLLAKRDVELWLQEHGGARTRVNGGACYKLNVVCLSCS